METLQKFIIEILVRFVSDTPNFFKIVRTIGLIVSSISGIALVINSNSELFGEAINTIVVQVIMYTGLVSTFIAQLTATTEAKRKEGLKD
jgi:hypothetical protein